jgi:hypothetical protein
MTDDEREAQTKLVSPAATEPGPEPTEPEAEAEPAAPDAAAAEAEASEPESQTKVPSPAPVARPFVVGSAPLKPAIPVVPEPAWPPLPVRLPVPAASPLEADDQDVEEDDVELTLAERLRRLPPAPVILTAGSIGSLLFLARAVTSHTTPVAVLISSAVVTGLIFGLDSAISSVATWRAAQDGESARALLLAVIGGVAALVCAGALAGTLVMILVLNS